MSGRWSLLLAAWAAACGPSPEVAPSSAARARVLPGVGTPGNFLLVSIDDVSADQLSVYRTLPEQAVTPTITALADAGVTFREGYAFPSCTPSRAALMTGRYPSRYGLGNALEADAEVVSLPLSEVTLPEALRASPYGYTSSLVGKWHLASPTSPAALFHPNDQGFDWASGSLENLGSSYSDVPGGTNYYHWERITNGVVDVVDTYATTATADAIVARAEAMPEPWFLYAAFNAPHVPHHRPPQRLVNSPVPENCAVDRPGCFRAALEAVDTELGRALRSIDPDVLSRTTIIFFADNGGASDTIEPPLDPTRGKGTVYDGGVRVPFIVAGAWVVAGGREDDHLVSMVDVFATVTELAEVPPLDRWDGDPLRTDSVSFANRLLNPAAVAGFPRSLYAFSEAFWEVGPPPYLRVDRMLRTRAFKLTHYESGVQFFRYAGDDEGDDLLEGGAPHGPDAAAVALLDDLFDALESDLVYEGP